MLIDFDCLFDLIFQEAAFIIQIDVFALILSHLLLLTVQSRIQFHSFVLKEPYLSL